MSGGNAIFNVNVTKSSNVKKNPKKKIVTVSESYKIK